MSIKYSVVRCLSNAVVKLPRNCWKRTWNIAVMKYFRNDTFRKKQQRQKLFSSNCSLITLFPNKKIKMKTQNAMTCSYYSKVTSTQNKGSLIFLLFCSHPEVFCRRGVLRNFTKFTGKHLCQSLFFNKIAGLGLQLY